MNSLKYFAEQRRDVHIAAGSLLGVKLSSPESLPVGKVNFLHLYPMKFLEFLDAMGESRYRKLIENVDRLVPITEAFHSHLIDLLRCYYPERPNLTSFVNSQIGFVRWKLRPGLIQEVKA